MVLGCLNTYSLTKWMDGLRLIVSICAMQVIVEKAERSDIPDIDKKKSLLNFSTRYLKIISTYAERRMRGDCMDSFV